MLLIGTLKRLTIIYDVPQGWSDPSEPACGPTGAVGTDLLGVPCPYTYSSYLHEVIRFAEVSTYVSGSTPGHEYAKVSGFICFHDLVGRDGSQIIVNLDLVDMLVLQPGMGWNLDFYFVGLFVVVLGWG